MQRLSILLSFLSLAACAPRHVVLMAPLTAPGSSFVCRATTDSDNCVPATTSNPGGETVSGSLYANLPAQCKGLVNKVIVRDLNKPAPTVEVTCAPADNQDGSTP